MQYPLWLKFCSLVFAHFLHLCSSSKHLQASRQYKRDGFGVVVFFACQSTQLRTNSARLMMCDFSHIATALLSEWFSRSVFITNTSSANTFIPFEKVFLSHCNDAYLKRHKCHNDFILRNHFARLCRSVLM